MSLVESPVSLEERPSGRSEWASARIVDVATKIRAGGTPRRDVPAYWNGNIPFVKIEDITASSGQIVATQEGITEEGLANSSAWIVPAGSVLLAMYASIGAVAINRIPVATNQAIIALVPDPRVVIAEYLMFALSQARARLAALNIQTTQKNITKGIVESFALPIPPMAEQLAIARTLAAPRAALAARQRELELERERKVALTEHLFTYGTRGEPRQQTEIGNVPQSWRAVELGSMAKIAYGVTVNQARRASPDRSPLLTVANVERGALRLKEVRDIGMLPGDAQTYRVQRGDVLFIEGNGNPRLLGSAATWRDELSFALHQNHLIRARPELDTVLSEWIMYYVNSDTGCAQLLGKAKTSSGLHSINSRVVARYLLPITSIEEQREIVSVLSCCDSKIAALQHEIALHEELFRTLLEELMSGQLSAWLLIDQPAA